MPARARTKPYLAAIASDRRGTVAVLFSLLIIPATLSVGVAVDCARLVNGRQALQDAVDDAALAGATVYSSSGQATAAASAATLNFGRAIFPGFLSVGAPVVTVGQGSTNFSGSANNVTVQATATMPMSFMALVMTSTSFTASATASNPIVKPKMSVANFASSAADWNAAYLYVVPMNNGQPDYTTIPNAAQFYEIGSNCNSGSSSYSAASRCNGQAGTIVSASQALPAIGATQPFAFALENMTDGMTAATGNGYGANGYGSQPGHVNWFYSGYEAAGQPPSQTANYSYTNTLRLGPISFNTTQTTNYPTASSSAAPNCSLLIAAVPAGASLPTSPPAGGQCFAANSTAAGSQYATLSCAQMQGQTYMIWWNDMGGSSDDKDYNDAYFSVSCQVGTTGTNGTGSSVGSGSGSTAVVLTQ